MNHFRQIIRLLRWSLLVIILLGMVNCSENSKKGFKKITTTEWKEYDGNYMQAVFPDSTKMLFRILEESHVELVSYSKKTGYIEYSGNLEIPQHIISNGKKHQLTSIGKALRESKVISVVIPCTVSTIDNNAFENCNELTNIQLPEGLESIGDYAFENCNKLTSLTVPNSVKHIGKESFFGCTNLKDLVLPNGLSLSPTVSKLKGYEWLEGVWAGAEGYDSFGRLIVTDSYIQVVNSNMDDAFADVEQQKKEDYSLHERPDYVTGNGDGTIFGFNEYIGVGDHFVYIIQGEFSGVMLDKIQAESFEDAVFKANHQYPARVCSNAYDGFVNIRQSPSSKAPILGVLKNGPDGAVLISREGDWTKVNYHGIEGYVSSQYIQDTPTEVFKGGLNDLMGIDAGNYQFTESDLTLLSAKDLTYLRNSVYAKHGYVFVSDELNNYFKQFKWYHPNSSVTETVLNDMEKVNVNFIKRYQEQNGKTYKPQ